MRSVARRCTMTRPSSEPAAAKARAAQARGDGRASARRPPGQLAGVVLDHQDDRAFVEPEPPRCNPAMRIAARLGERRVEARVEPGAVVPLELELLDGVMDRFAHEV